MSGRKKRSTGDYEGGKMAETDEWVANVIFFFYVSFAFMVMLLYIYFSVPLFLQCNLIFGAFGRVQNKQARVNLPSDQWALAVQADWSASATLQETFKDWSRVPTVTETWKYQGILELWFPGL